MVADRLTTILPLRRFLRPREREKVAAGRMRVVGWKPFKAERAGVREDVHSKGTASVQRTRGHSQKITRIAPVSTANPTNDAKLFQRQDGMLQPRLVHLPRYFDGLRIRSSRSISSSFRTARCRLCRTAFMKDRGRNQACLTSTMIVRPINLNVFTGHDYPSDRPLAMGCSPHCEGAAPRLSS